MYQKLSFLLMGLLCLYTNVFAQYEEHQLIHYKMDNRWLPDVANKPDGTQVAHDFQNNSCYLTDDPTDANNHVLRCAYRSGIQVQPATNSLDAYTINIWFYLEDSRVTDKKRRIFHKGDEGGTYEFERFDYSLLVTDNKLIFQVGAKDGSAAISLVTGENSIETNKWYMATCCYNHSTKTAKLYLNGELVETGTHTKELKPADEDLFLNHFSDADPQNVEGYLDDYTVYDEILEESSIKSLYNKIIPVTPLAHYSFEELYSYDSNNKKMMIGPKVSSGFHYERSIFLSVNSRYGIGPVDLQDFTYNIWFKPRAIGSTQRILHNGGRGSEAHLYNYSIVLNTEGYVEFWMGNKAGEKAINLKSNERLEADKWYMITVCFDKTTKLGQLYLNGDLNEAANASSELMQLNDAHVNLAYYQKENPQYAAGAFDDILVYDTVLDANTIKEMAANGTEVPTIIMTSSKNTGEEWRLNMSYVNTSSRLIIKNGEKCVYSRFSNLAPNVRFRIHDNTKPIIIYGFDNITSLACHNCKLNTLDVKNSTSLIFLGCGDNNLKQLDISNNKKLEGLYCSINQLESLVIGENTVIKEISCHDNQLKSLDVSRCSALQELNCHDNALEKLEVGNQLIWKLYCYNNQLTYATLPLPNNRRHTYYIAPQARIIIDEAVTVGQAIDLSSQDLTINGRKTSYKWKTASGQQLTSGIDFKVSNGITTFLQPQSEKVFCEINNYAFYKDGARLRLITTEVAVSTSTAIDNEAIDDISIYPNPCKDVLYFRNVPKQNLMVRIIDLSGTTVLNKTLHENKVNIERLPKGTYIFQLFNDGLLLKTGKLLKL